MWYLALFAWFIVWIALVEYAMDTKVYIKKAILYVIGMLLWPILILFYIMIFLMCDDKDI